MGFHWPNFFKPHAVIPHVVFVTRKEPRESKELRAGKELALLQYLASRGVTQPEQLRAARELGATVRLGRG